MNIDNSTVLLAFSLTILAGLSTGIGSILAFFTKTTNTKFLSVSLGFSAGVMIYVSMIEIFQQAKIILIANHGEIKGTWITILAFFLGIIFIGIIDRLIPSEENPHEIKRVEELKGNKEANNKKLYRMGILTAIAIAIHNFPEGIAVFISGLADPKIAIPTAIAIAIHNIPEGIAVSVPISFATGNRKKAFFLSFFSGLAEPIGALLAFVFLKSFFSETFLGITFASVAGIMIFISLDELLPTAHEYGHHHLSIYGLITGMAIMAISLVLFL